MNNADKTKAQHPKRPAFIVKSVLLIIGAFFAVYSVLMIPLINFNAGIVFVLVAGIVFLLAGAFFELIKQIKWVLYIILIISLLIISLMIFIACYGLNDNTDYKEDAVLVLGSGIKGETVAPQLALRLDTAVEYCTVNTQAVIVVSGGQGPQEAITEALAMERYLISTNYHMYRAAKTAEKIDFDINRLHSPTVWYEVPIRYLRECAAVLKLWVENIT